MHMSSPLRNAVQKMPGVQDRETVLRAVVGHLVELASSAKGEAQPKHLRALPYLLYLSDRRDHNVFTAKRSGNDAKLQQRLQRLFKKYPNTECSPPPEMVEALGLQEGFPLHLGTVLARCPNYHPSMRTKVRGLLSIALPVSCVP
jgi:hypothetical protein